MKKTYNILSVIGAVIWSATIFLRDTSLINNNIIKGILDIAPNFGVVFVLVGISITCYPTFFKKEFNNKHIYYLLGIVLLFLLGSEIIHDLFLNSSFDIWDMVVSIIASLIIVLINWKNYGK